MRKKRITMLSPSFKGKDETRISRSMLAIFNSILPSCGRLFSAMSIPDNIFNREITGNCKRLGMVSASCSTPSTRYRIRLRPLTGSMCISEAPIFKPLAIKELSKLTVGASLASSRNLSSSSSDSADRSSSMFSVALWLVNCALSSSSIVSLQTTNLKGVEKQSRYC